MTDEAPALGPKFIVKSTDGKFLRLDMVFGSFAELIRDLRLTVTDLKKQVETLEARPELAHRGVWKGDVQYKENSLITHKGGLWIATVESKGCRPGEEGSSIWRLIVKSGHAG